MLVLVLVLVLVVGRGRYTRNRVGSGMGSDSTEVQWFDDGNDDGNDEVDGPQSQWVDDGNDWVDGTACWDFGKADRTREADRTRNAATAVGTVGTVVAGGTSSCVRCGIGGLFGGD